MRPLAPALLLALRFRTGRGGPAPQRAGEPGQARRGPTARCVASLLALAALTGCAAPGTDYEALPFYREDRTEAAAVRAEAPLVLLALDAAIPAPISSATELAQGFTPHEDDPQLQEREHRGLGFILRFPWPFGMLLADGHHHTFTLTSFVTGPVGSTGPLGRALATDAAVRKNPFVNFGSDPESGGFNSIPFVGYDDEVDHRDLPDMPGTELDGDTGLLPFVAWGSGDQPGEDYLAVAPFGGTTRGLIGKDEITWVGFPLPLYARVEDRSYTSHHVLFPLVNWVDGPRNDGFRVLPFFGHYERLNLRGQPHSEKTFVLWPLVTWQTDGIDEKAPVDTFFAFPFYGQIRGPDRDVTTVLFPFFKYEDEKYRGRWELRAPFPFLILGGSDDGRFRLDMWPLFGVKSRPEPDYLRWFVLWPLLRRETIDDPGGSSFSGTWCLPLFWRTAWHDHETGKEDTETKVFPLFHYRSARDGSVDFATLSPWWKNDDGFDRTLGALFRLYHYRRDRFGGTEHQALLGLASWRDLPARPGRAAYSRLSLLFGLVQARSHGDEGGLRLLWVLPEITWGEVGPAPPWTPPPLMINSAPLRARNDDEDVP